MDVAIAGRAGRQSGVGRAGRRLGFPAGHAEGELPRAGRARRRRSRSPARRARPATGRWRFRSIRLPAAERETGGVAVEVLGAGEISGREPRGLDPADPSELGEPLRGRESPSMVAFRYRAAGRPRSREASRWPSRGTHRRRC